MAFVNGFVVPQVFYLPVAVQQTPPDKNDIETQTFGLNGFVNDNLNALLDRVKKQYPHLQCRVLSYGDCGKWKSLEITRMKADVPFEKGGPLTLASVTVFEDLSSKLMVCGDEICSKELKDEEGQIDWKSVEWVLALLSSKHVYCSGVSLREFRTVCGAIRYQPKGFIKKHYPNERYVSKKCLKWYVMRSNASKAERDEITSGNGRCHECNKTYRNVRHRNKIQLPKFNRKAWELRTAASSNYPYALMSPRQQKRKRGRTPRKREKN